MHMYVTEYAKFRSSIGFVLKKSGLRGLMEKYDKWGSIDGHFNS